MRAPKTAIGTLAFTLLSGCGSPTDSVDDASGGALGGTSTTTGGSTSTTSGGSVGTSGGTNGSGGAAAATAGGAAGSSAGGGGGTSAAGTSGAAGSGGTTVKNVGSCEELPDVGTWEDITPTPERGLDGTVYNTQALMLDPFDAQTLWLGTARPNGTHSDQRSGVFKSTDCGSTWAHVNTGENGSELDKSSLWSMAIDPVDQGVMYAVGAYGALGLFQSTNSGVDWQQLFGSGTEYATHVQYNFVGGIIMDPTDHQHLVATAHASCSAPYGSGDSSCQAETLDSGATWKLVPNPDALGFIENAGAYLIGPDNWIYATPFGSTYRTTNHGDSWSVVGPAIEAGESGHHPLVVAPDGNYYLPSDSGVVRSTDDGASWSVIAGSGGGYGFAMGDNHLYICPEFSLNYQTASLDDLSTWTKLPNPESRAEGRGSAFMDYDEDHHILYTSNFEGGLFRMLTQ